MDMEIPADTIRVIVGGSSILPENTLSQTNPPPASPLLGALTSPEWEDLLASRGQAGALDLPPTDYAPWGGATIVNSDDVKWHFGATTDGLDPDETDFLTLAMHELMHIFGFGPAESFVARIDGDGDSLNFTGYESAAVGSDTNPQLMMYDGGHWSTSTRSTAGGHEKKALMLMLDGVRETEAYAEVLGLSKLDRSTQQIEVKRTKDRLVKKLRRYGQKIRKS